MIIALTGTPGTGKSAAAKILRKRGYKAINLNRIIISKKFFSSYDKKRKCHVVDLKKLSRYVKEKFAKRKEVIILDSHISHLLDVDFAIVLRCSPEELEKRLKKKKWKKDKIRENVEAEMIDLIAVEAEENLGKKKVFEIDTTGKTPEEVAKEVEKIVKVIRK